MTRAGGQQKHITRVDNQFPAAVAAQGQRGRAFGDAEDLVAFRMIVMEVVDAVAPGWRPAIVRKALFHRGGEISLIRRESLLVDESREARVVWDRPALLEG